MNTTKKPESSPVKDRKKRKPRLVYSSEGPPKRQEPQPVPLYPDLYPK